MTRAEVRQEQVAMVAVADAIYCKNEFILLVKIIAGMQCGKNLNHPHHKKNYCATKYKNMLKVFLWSKIFNRLMYGTLAHLIMSISVPPLNFPCINQGTIYILNCVHSAIYFASGQGFEQRRYFRWGLKKKQRDFHLMMKTICSYCRQLIYPNPFFYLFIISVMWLIYTHSHWDKFSGWVCAK